MKPLSPGRKASLGMTVVLCIAVVAGASSAVFNSHSAQATAVRSAPSTSSISSAGPASAPASASDDTNSALTGSVLETFPASKYTYLRLATSAGESWAAVPSTTVALGTRVTVENATRMTGFKSSTLERTFDVIYFGTLAASSTPAGAPHFSPVDVLDDDEQRLPAGHPDIGSAAPDSIGSSDTLPAGHPAVAGPADSPHAALTSPSGAEPALAVAPARGRDAHVISDLTAQRLRLAGKLVRVRGQVTKVTPDVQGHTFFHLRDGQPGAPVTDLAVTSRSTPERGQVATFEGTLRADVDIGIGYSYPVLLENAVVVSE
ncbi:MAG: hypothetical protein ABW061_23840 [Polyangiaceae bacterium]